MTFSHFFSQKYSMEVILNCIWLIVMEGWGVKLLGVPTVLMWRAIKSACLLILPAIEVGIILTLINTKLFFTSCLWKKLIS